VLDQEQDDPPCEEEEDELRERVRRIDITRRVDDRRHHEERQRRTDRIAPIETGPDGVNEVNDEEADEDRGVRNVHRTNRNSGFGLLPYPGPRARPGSGASPLAPALV